MPRPRQLSSGQAAWARIAPYAILCLGCFLCAVGVLFVLLEKADQLHALGLIGPLYYVVLLPLGLAVAGFLFGVLLADQNPGAYLPQVAQTLNNLGILDWTENRLAEAPKEFDEALQHDQQLADQNPAIYQPDVAQTLNNLGILDCTENRMADARKAFEDSLAIYTKFAATDPARYKLEVERETALLKSVKN